VAFTYNDPIVFLEYAVDTAEACHARGLRTVAVTNGYICPEPRAELFGHVDAANVDLKAFTEDFYHELTGAHLEPVLDTLRWLVHESDVWVEVTTLVIPGHNDSDAELRRMAQWFVRELGPDVPWHFSAFHPDFKMLDVPPTPLATLRRARRIAKEAGARHVYTGNVRDPEGAATLCHACGATLVRRDGYEILEWNLERGPEGEAGSCSRCGARCPGVFEERPGDWGARRRPVRLAEFERT
jgi:pyruvate formate lyase activating enzyme